MVRWALNHHRVVHGRHALATSRARRCSVEPRGPRPRTACASRPWCSRATSSPRVCDRSCSRCSTRCRSSRARRAARRHSPKRSRAPFHRPTTPRAPSPASRVTTTRAGRRSSVTPTRPTSTAATDARSDSRTHPHRHRFVGHGHGLGVAVVRADADTAAASALALDVAAYDQRGCLSPQEVLVVGTPRAGEAFAERLADALASIETTLPRGPLPTELAAASRRWQDVVLATGELSRAPRPRSPSIPPACCPSGPGIGTWWCVCSARRRAPTPRAASAGTSRRSGSDRTFRRRGFGRGRPRVSPIGTMQTPPMDAPLDGLPPSEGYLVRRPAR
ncbi:MAG: acyl-CoA reductase [Polyangiales bacterium]